MHSINSNGKPDVTFSVSVSHGLDEGVSLVPSFGCPMYV